MTQLYRVARVLRSRLLVALRAVSAHEVRQPNRQLRESSGSGDESRDGLRFDRLQMLAPCARFPQPGEGEWTVVRLPIS